MDQKKLTFGILCNGLHLHKWEWQAVQHLMEHPDIELVMVVVNDNPEEKPGLLQKLKNYPFHQLIFRLFYKYFVKITAFEQIDISAISKKVKTIYCRTSKKGYSEYFSDEDVNQIQQQQPDLLLRFGFSILKGKILTAAKYGIWSFHHDDEQKYRGGPAGVWEILKNDPVNGAILQRITGKLDAGIILKKGWFKTINHSYAGNYDQLLFQTAKWPLQVCKDILSGNAEYFDAAPSSSKAPIYRVPSNIRSIYFIFKLLWNKLRFHYNELFKSEEWNIAVVNKPISKIVSTEIDITEVDWAPAPAKNTFLADPFGYADNNLLYVYSEEYFFQTKKAKISRITYSNKGFSQPETTLEKPYHLSYPYLFRYGSDSYCVPENFQNRSVDLYKLDADGKPVFVKHLLEDFEAVDPTFFQHNGRWWLFCTDGNLADTNLFAFYADDPLSEFQPHHNNPIKTDVCSARPAGTPFTTDGKLYRPSQNCSITYGGSVVLSEIIELTPDKFVEVALKEHFPIKGRYNKGLHTMSVAGNYTLIDGKRYIFNFEHFRYQLQRKFNKVRGKSSK